ncbi:hypothetical protein BpHYR1_008920 [Brachionus plicatilis]|uniref:Uncharacterized protein n=1 Tax=Brachionus plicatilis TaxID=10195 RepID=A0A3M7RL24_BRAPC|nr:hypothetical protein BpHYR1_008920 [Brachionus plicatilis]
MYRAFTEYDLVHPYLAQKIAQNCLIPYLLIFSFFKIISYFSFFFAKNKHRNMAPFPLTQFKCVLHFISLCSMSFYSTLSMNLYECDLELLSKIKERMSDLRLSSHVFAQILLLLLYAHFGNAWVHLARLHTQTTSTIAAGDRRRQIARSIDAGHRAGQTGRRGRVKAGQRGRRRSSNGLERGSGRVAMRQRLELLGMSLAVQPAQKFPQLWLLSRDLLRGVNPLGGSGGMAPIDFLAGSLGVDSPLRHSFLSDALSAI